MQRNPNMGLRFDACLSQMKLLYNQMCQVHLKRMTEEIGNYRRNPLITVPERESPEFLKRFCLLNVVFACWLNKGMKRRDRQRTL